jgi:arylsulfatase A-like enzyme
VPPEERPPNIILITLDDLGWHTLPAYGNPHIETPTIDRIVADGALFTNAFGASSSCSSSRATFVTGQHIARHGVNGLVHRYPEASLADRDDTVAAHLGRQGYATALLGKWHVSEMSPTRYGYDINLNEPGEYSEHIDTPDKFDAYIREVADRPFYLELNFLATHLRAGGFFPNDPPLDVDPDSIDVLPTWTLPSWPEIREVAAAYFSQVRRVDALLADLVATLEELGLYETTVLALVSDNGCPLPGNKKTLFDRGIGTPLILSWPAGFRGRQAHDDLVSVVDLAPTLLDAAMADPLPNADGRSLLPWLRGEDHTPDSAVFSAIDFHGDYTPMRSVRTERFKLIRSYGDNPIGLGQLSPYDWAHRVTELENQRWKDPLPPVMLYDLQADPHEQDNLAQRPEFAEDLARLHDLLQAHLEEVDDDFAGVPL